MDSSASRKRGRPTKPFDQLSSISKGQKIQKICSELSTDELVLATEKSFKSGGFGDAAKLINILAESPKTATDFLKFYVKQKNTKNYTSDEALALMMDLRSSTRQYITMYEGSKVRNNSIYPPYHQISAAKKKFYPAKETIRISELGFIIDLQSILDITTKRLVQALSASILSQPVLKLRMISKWGFDGASSQSQYKQKFQECYCDDSSIFLTTFVPIVLHVENQPENTYWKNIKTSSTTLCRPIRLAFKKESKECTLQTIVTEGCLVEIYHELICTMIDGKICQHLTETKSTQTCFICKANPTDMNKLDLVYERPKCTAFYKYGLSTLHAWIRFLECVLNVSYNMAFKKWSVRDPAHKILQKQRKQQIQNEFIEKTGLRVDFVNQGAGTSNDGNTARRFFRHFELSAQITGFDVGLLKRFSMILQTISSRKKINVEAFGNYTRETARMYVNLYEWYYMPVTVHKILVHGSDVIEHALVPIGQLSEEVQESRHKEVRRYRECNTRKSTRLKTNEDLLHSLLISSDPLISSYRRIFPSKKLEHFEETNQMLAEVDEFESDSD